MQLIIPCEIVQHDDYRVSFERREDSPEEKQHLETLYTQYIENMSPERFEAARLASFGSSTLYPKYLAHQSAEISDPNKSDVEMMAGMMTYLQAHFLDQISEETMADILSIADDFVNDLDADMTLLGYRLENLYGETARSNNITSIMFKLPGEQGDLEICLLPDIESIVF